MNITRDQIDAMDDTVAYAASHHARASAELAHLEMECGVIPAETRQSTLVRRISHRQGMLARYALTEKMRRDLEDANDMDEQELCLIGSKRTASILAQWAWGLAVVILAVAGLVHLLANNW